MKEPMFNYDEATSTTICIIEDKDKTFVGYATCHPDDMEFCSVRTGEQIAATRAYIDYLKDIKRDIQFELKSFKRFYNDIKNMPQYNKEDYTVRHLLKIIKKLTEELSTVQSDIKQEKKNLSLFIDSKNELYRKLEKQKARQE